MIRTIILILVIITFSVSVGIFFKLIWQLRLSSEINRLLLVSFVINGFIILYKCFRLLFFTFYLQLNDDLDVYFFDLSFVLILVNISVTARMMHVLYRQSGHQFKYEIILRYGYLLFAVILSSINIFTIYVTPSDIYGFYLYQISPIISLSVTFGYSPLFALLAHQMRKIQNSMKKKGILNHLSSLGLLFMIIPLVNFAYVGSFYVIPNLTVFNITYLIGTLIIITIIVFSLARYPNLLESITMYFCAKSLYIIEESGQMIYSYNFQEINEEYFTSKEFLIGGFIHAITSGIQTTIKSSEKVQAIDLGDTTLIIKHGKYVFGVLLATENEKSLHKKLNIFIEKFENQFASILKDWDGEVTSFTTKAIHSILDDVFSFSK